MNKVVYIYIYVKHTHIYNIYIYLFGDAFIDQILEITGGGR